MLDKEQQAVVDRILSGESLYIEGPPGTGKTEIFNEVGRLTTKYAAFLPFTKAACAELKDRAQNVEYNDGVPVLKGQNITIQTINSYCQSQLEQWPGSYEQQLTSFLESKRKKKYSLVGIDEVQDLRPIHLNVIKAIKNRQLFAAGDRNQTIFVFSDAMGYRIFPELEKMHCSQVNLTNNYRSGRSITDILTRLSRNPIVPKGPKTFGRDVVLARTHTQLKIISTTLKQQDVPHIIRGKDGISTQVGEGKTNIYLMVLHACKGLGFDRVFVEDWQENKGLPLRQEESNLVYVAVSRASHKFFVVDPILYYGYCTSTLKSSNYDTTSIRNLRDRLKEPSKPTVTTVAPSTHYFI